MVPEPSVKTLLASNMALLGFVVLMCILGAQATMDLRHAAAMGENLIAFLICLVILYITNEFNFFQLSVFK